MFKPTNAYFDQGICCMLQVRENIKVFQNDPWTICDTDHNYVYLSPGQYQSVPATMGWCQQNCGGYQLSSSDEWLRPLATWILPMVAVLLLCSVGESEEKEEPDEDNGKNRSWRDKICSWPQWDLMRDPVTGFRYKAQEYIALLGDPASAICGGFSEIVADARVLTLKPSDWFDQGMVGVSTLAGSTKFEEKALRRTLLNNVETNGQTMSEPNSSDAISVGAITDSQSGTSQDKDIRAIKELLINNDRVKDRLYFGIRVMLKARLDFINAIFLPVVLLFATTASSFHDAYDANGDVETARNLSYGVWYSWVIILAVVSNSYAASANPGVAQAAIGDLVDLSAPTLPLRKRFPNAMVWGN
jgi:hypothetical protein